MKITVTKQNINEINKILPDLTTWLITNTVHAGTAAICLQAIIEETKRLSKELEEED